MKINVIVCDNTEPICRYIAKKLLKAGINAVCSRCGHDDVYRSIAEVQPTVIILMVYNADDTYDFIAELKEKYPDIHIFTGAYSSIMDVHYKLIEYGADYSFFMPVNSELLIDAIFQTIAKEKKSPFEEVIEEYLTEVGFSPKLNGFRYLSAAIEMCFNEPELLSGKVCEIYSRIAEKFRTEAKLVERSLRTLSEKAHSEGALSLFYDRKPSNSELICIVCDSFMQYIKG